MKFAQNMKAGLTVRKKGSQAADGSPSFRSRIRSNWVCLLSFAIPFLIMLTISSLTVFSLSVTKALCIPICIISMFLFFPKC